MEKVTVGKVEYNLEDKDAALVKAIKDLTRVINNKENK